MAVTSNGTGGGNWSDGSTWDGGVAPTPTDDVVIAAGDTVTLTANAECGNSPDNQTTWAVDIGSGALIDTGAYTLKVKGNLRSAAFDRCMRIGAGGKLDVDASGSTGSNQEYVFQMGSGDWIEARGTSGSRATIESNSGGANFAFTNWTASTGVSFDAEYCDFNRIGTATTAAAEMHIKPANVSTLRMHNCKWDDYGELRVIMYTGGTTTLSLQDTEFAECNFSSNQIAIDGSVSGLTGSHAVTRCKFTDSSKYALLSGGGITFTNCYFTRHWRTVDQYNSTMNGGHLMDACFVNKTDSEIGSIIGTVQDSVFLSNHTVTNHAMASVRAYYDNSEVKGCIYDDIVGAGDPTADLLRPANKTGYTCKIENNIMLFNSVGVCPGKLVSMLINESETRAKVNHNTIFTSHDDDECSIGVGEFANDITDGINELQSNLWVGLATNHGFRVVRHADSTAQDLVTKDGCSNNWGFNLRAGSEGGGFECRNTSTAMFSAGTPNDLVGTADPQLVDASRNVCTYDNATSGLNNPNGTQWVGTPGGNHTEGDIVSNTDAGFYNSTVINFRCIQTHARDTANSEPGVGTAWRDYWEPATLYRIREDLTLIDSLHAWIRAGIAPQNQDLKGAAHDGGDIGAVPVAGTAITTTVTATNAAGSDQEQFTWTEVDPP